MASCLDSLLGQLPITALTDITSLPDVNLPEIVQDVAIGSQTSIHKRMAHAQVSRGF